MTISDEVLFLEEAFEEINKKYFESALSKPAITIQSTPRCHGHFTPYDAWEDNSGTKLKEINIGAESLRRPIVEIVATLIHEMVHYYCHEQGIQDVSRSNTYHNKRFKEEAEKRGLIISRAPGIGYSVTKPSSELETFVKSMGWTTDKLKMYRKVVTNRSQNGGKDSTSEGSKSSTRKYVCPICGMSVRATKVVRIACVDCGNVLMLSKSESTEQ